MLAEMGVSVIEDFLLQVERVKKAIVKIEYGVTMEKFQKCFSRIIYQMVG
jgi:hypothetical protein